VHNASHDTADGYNAMRPTIQPSSLFTSSTSFRGRFRYPSPSMSSNNNRPAINQSMRGSVKELEEIMKKSIDPESCVFLHPGDNRKYDSKELLALRHRDFETRLFITATQCDGDTVFLRTHHTDNAQHRSHFNYVRDLLKAAHITENFTCAKSTLTTLLTMCFELSSSDYYTFAISLASGLSSNGKNTMFEMSDVMVHNQEEVACFRERLCLLMDVIFNKMAKKKYLLDDKRSNIFRLVYCKTKFKKFKNSIFHAMFSFALQLCLTSYVVLHNKHKNQIDQFNYSMFALASFTLTYSIMVAVSTISETYDGCKKLFKHDFGMLMIMDVVVNMILPLILAYYGFLLILAERKFIDAVLNTTALLFIPEIDDQLPKILGYREDDIIRNFLITESMEDLDKILSAQQPGHNILSGLQFGDFYITNMIEQGINAQEGCAFQPYQVTQGITDSSGHQIDPSTTVTPDCLLRKIEWRYTTGFRGTTKPRVGSLRLTKMNGHRIDIVRKSDINGNTDVKVGIDSKENILEGLFIITTFQMSEDVIKLRLCGSYDPKNFLKAFDYYSLWHVTLEARNSIKKYTKETKYLKEHKTL